MIHRQLRIQTAKDHRFLVTISVLDQTADSIGSVRVDHD